MTNKLPTINIKGNQYVLVKDRILAFNEHFPNGSIQSEIVSPIESQIVIVKAIVIPDVTNEARRFIDYSQAKIGGTGVNATSALENASTSAVGRALAYMGIGVIDSVASGDEVYKAVSYSEEKEGEKKIYATPKQVTMIAGLLNKKGQKDEDLKAKYNVESKNDLTIAQASQIIENLLKLPDVELPVRDINDD